MKKSDIKESYVKQLRTLLEGEVEQAEVIIAAKGFSKEIQEMIEKVGRLMNEQLGPVSDQMRQTYDSDIAQSFQEAMQSELEGVLEALRTSKEQIDQYITGISEGTGIEPVSDMDGEFDVDGEFDDFEDIDSAGVDDEIGDAFGGDEAMAGPIDEPLGRAPMESRQTQLQNQLVEMRTMLAKARKIKEAQLMKKK